MPHIASAGAARSLDVDALHGDQGYRLARPARRRVPERAGSDVQDVELERRPSITWPTEVGGGRSAGGPW